MDVLLYTACFESIIPWSTQHQQQWQASRERVKQVRNHDLYSHMKLSIFIFLTLTCFYMNPDLYSHLLFTYHLLLHVFYTKFRYTCNFFCLCIQTSVSIHHPTHFFLCIIQIYMTSFTECVSWCHHPDPAHTNKNVIHPGERVMQVRHHCFFFQQ